MVAENAEMKTYRKRHDDSDGDVLAVDLVNPKQVCLGEIALIGISNRKGDSTTHLILETVVTGMEMTTVYTISSRQTVKIHHVSIIDMGLSDCNILLGNKLAEVVVCIDEYLGQTPISKLLLIKFSSRPTDASIGTTDSLARGAQADALLCCLYGMQKDLFVVLCFLLFDFVVIRGQILVDISVGGRVPVIDCLGGPGERELQRDWDRNEC